MNMSLPTEIWNEILLNLELKDIYKMMCLNNYFYSIAIDILEKRWDKLLDSHNISNNNFQKTKDLLTLKELKIYIRLCFLLKKDIHYYDRITLTLFNTQIHKNYFTFNSLNCQSHYTFMIYCPIRVYNIERALSFTKVNGKNIKISNISNYYYNNNNNNNNKVSSKKHISIFRKNIHEDQIENGYVTYFLKGIEFI